MEDAWAETREAQAMTVATVPNTCLAVTVDTGEADNIHPKDKAPVGDRLARCALAKQYGKHVSYQGPTVDKVEKQSGCIRLHFTHTDGGLTSNGEKLGQFQIAGDDRKMDVGGCTYIRGICHRVDIANPEPCGCALRMAIKSCGDTIQWRRSARGSIPYRRLEGHHRRPSTILDDGEAKQSLALSRVSHRPQLKN